MKISVLARPVIYAPFTIGQVAALSKLSAMHYDATCKQAGVVGGFIYGWLNLLKFAEGTDEPITVQADLRELDLVLKICECLIGLDPVETENIENLKKMVRMIIAEVQKAARNWAFDFTIPGDERSEWLPLEKVLTVEECGNYMFMGTQFAEVDGQQVEVFLYKHRMTRCYLNLDTEGRSFQFTGSGYVLEVGQGK